MQKCFSVRFWGVQQTISKTSGSAGCSAHPEKGWNWVKFAQLDPCVCAALPVVVVSHCARLWGPAASLESLKFAVQPGPAKWTSDSSFTWTHPGFADCRLPSLPGSDGFRWWPSSSSSLDSEPWSRSLPPFSMPLLELPAEVRVAPNLQRWKKEFTCVAWNQTTQSFLSVCLLLPPTLFWT